MKGTAQASVDGVVLSLIDRLRASVERSAVLNLGT